MTLLQCQILGDGKVGAGARCEGIRCRSGHWKGHSLISKLDNGQQYTRVESKVCKPFVLMLPAMLPALLELASLENASLSADRQIRAKQTMEAWCLRPPARERTDQ